MPLHTDHRPTSLNDIIGNMDTVQALRTHLKKDKPNRCILLTGLAGGGKTTIGHCLGHELGILPDPNGWNFRELNSANFRGIDTVRDIDEEARKPPLGGSKARMWLMEECHMWTKDAKEASLKLLENPPRNAWFVLTTSDPQKFFSGLKDPTAMKRRLTEYVVQPVSDRELSMLLTKVAKREGKKVPLPVIAQIILNALGSCGMALNLLDKIIDLQPEQMERQVKLEAERANTVIFLGKTLLDLHRSKKKGKGVWEKTLCPMLKQLEEEDPENVRRQVLEYMRKVFLGGDESVYTVMACFSVPYYDTGKAGLLMSVYEAFCLEV